MGQACIRGMRISVSLVLNLVANGMSNKEILAEHPDLEEEDIRQCLTYAALLDAMDHVGSQLEQGAAVTVDDQQTRWRPCQYVTSRTAAGR